LYIQRKIDIERVRKLINNNNITAILGPRQSGKTTLAKHFDSDYVFDLENPRDLASLENPQLTLEKCSGLIVIDEIQRKPNLFPILRYLTDYNKNQKYLILGSASRELIKQSSESLAGRIAYYTLLGFRKDDITKEEIDKLWFRGNLPLSFLSESNNSSYPRFRNISFIINN
jgi:uncharacterized protein